MGEVRAFGPHLARINKICTIYEWEVDGIGLVIYTALLGDLMPQIEM